MHELHATSMKARAEFHYGAIAFMYGMLMWMATEADGLIVFWSWVAIDKIAEDLTVHDVMIRLHTCLRCAG